MNRSRSVSPLLLLPAAAGILLILTATSRFGAGLTPDSAAYISTARNLCAGRGYVQYDGNPFVAWPPLFPTLLAFLELCRVDPLSGGRIVNALAFGLILLV